MEARLPNADAAAIDRRKFIEYALSTEHARGQDKARVFRSALGITIADSEVLIRAIRFAAQTEPATPSGASPFGSRYVLDFRMVHGDRSAMVRTCWIIRTGEDFPRLTSCYVL